MGIFANKIRLPRLAFINLTLRRLNAKAVLDKADNPVTVLKESIIIKETTPSFKNKDKRSKLLNIHAEKRNDALVLKTDVRFNTPIGAADFCLERAVNGKTEWHNKDKRLLSVYL
ncbi:DUF4357 domain-containing protein [Hoylesella oralis]|uniref:DUF4357 domain-containing protein n=2 Tax=Hoylesella oralis TaxID=28134 RepID=UPI00361CD359